MATCASISQFGSHFISEFRIVLLGNRGAGKTSLANVILCRQVTSPRRTAQCTKIRGVAAGRLVTVIDTPGWWKNMFVNNTPEFQKQELLLSTMYCPPGPHAVLLVIRVDTLYSAKIKQSAEEHMELLGKDVWRHTIVVFTYGENLQEQTMERRIESESETFLQGLVNKCGNRYLVLNVDRYNGSQVRELIEMIEYMVAGNSGCHYELDRECLYKIKEMKRMAEETANKIRATAQESEEIHEGKTGFLSSMRLVLLGYRRAGKTSVRNNIFGKAKSDFKRTRQCVKTQSEVAGKLITAVDTPGWWKSLPARDTPELDKLEMLCSTSLCLPGPHALLLILRSDMSFREEERKSVEEHMDLLGEHVWNHTIVLFTHGDVLGDVTIEEYIESEGTDLKLLVAKCRNRYHVFNNNNFVDGRQVTGLLEKIEVMVAENEGFHYEMDQRTSKEARHKLRFVGKKSKMKLKVKKQSGVTRPVKGSGYLSELSLVLLGYGSAGKTSTGNTILMGATFGSKRTSQCVRRTEEVAGRFITVVDTPGWFKRLPLAYTPQLHKRELAECRDLTSGPVAYLLVIRLDSSFQEDERRAVEDHMKLFGRTVWDQTMVVFTCGDWLGDRAIELHVENEGEHLKWILENCGNRYCIFNNKNQNNNFQVSDLLETVEQMLMENEVCHSEGTLYLKEARRKLWRGWVKERRIQKPNDDYSSDDDDVFIAYGTF